MKEDIKLHEVIRLSGMNLIIDDLDMPLIIKVASIPKERMQVYFIDNEEYFKNRLFRFRKRRSCIMTMMKEPFFSQKELLKL